MWLDARACIAERIPGKKCLRLMNIIYSFIFFKKKCLDKCNSEGMLLEYFNF